MAGVEGCSDFCMGAVFMSVILRGMIFDVFATPRRARQGTAGTEQAKNTQKVQPTQHGVT